MGVVRKYQRCTCEQVVLLGANSVMEVVEECECVCLIVVTSARVLATTAASSHSSFRVHSNASDYPTGGEWMLLLKVLV